MVRDNRLRDELEHGETVIGARAKTHAPALIEVYGGLGLDFVWLDLEHGGPSPYDTAALESYTRAADAAEIDLLVRVPTNDPPVIRKVLDTGVRTILIPRMDTAEQLRRAVEASRFEYDGETGERGWAAGRAAAYGENMDDYAAHEDASVLVGTQIESAEAVENVEEILDVPEIGFAIVGHGDLAASMGHVGNPDHPDVQEAIDTARDACLDAGVPIGRVPDGVDDARRAAENGYQVLRIGDEIEAVRSVVGDRVRELRDADVV